MAGIFKAYDVRGVYPNELNEETAYWIGLALANRTFKPGYKIVVSRDCRLHSEPLSQSLIKGLTEGGCNVLDIGLAATPMNYWANLNWKADGSVMVTASHNPPKYNGFKVSLAEALPVDYSSGLNLVEDFVNNKQKPSGAITPGTIQTIDSTQTLPKYLDFMHSFMPKKINRKLKIAIDAANGMAALFMKAFCERYDWIEPVYLYCDLDGSFPNHEADPQKAENLRHLQVVVKELSCDFGIGFDGDADRAGFVDETGQIVSNDLMTALLATHYLKEKPGATILYDLRSSHIVEESIKDGQGKPIRSKVGHSFIKRQMRQEGAIFAGELSGHFYFQECFSTDSALMALIKVLCFCQEQGEKFSDSVNHLRKYFTTGEISFKVQNSQQILQKIEKEYHNLNHDYLDGLTVSADNWWFNLRCSNTEPLLRLNLEAHSLEMKERKLREVSELIQS